MESLTELKDLKEKIDIVKNDLLGRLPGVSHTVCILLWDDGTSRVECRHGEDAGDKYIIHTSVFYDGKLEYKAEPSLSNQMKVAPDGRWYYIAEKELK